MQLAGFTLLGANAENGKRLLVSIGIVAAVIAARYAIVGVVRLVTGEKPNERVVCWTRQGASLATAVLAAAALPSVWFENSGPSAPARAVGEGTASHSAPSSVSSAPASPSRCRRSSPPLPATW